MKEELMIDTVTLTIDDGQEVECGVITVLEMQGKDYIVLSPLDEEGEFTEDVWIYGLVKGESDDDEPEILYIDDDEEYEQIADKFDEWLDTCEFEEA